MWGAAPVGHQWWVSTVARLQERTHAARRPGRSPADETTDRVAADPKGCTMAEGREDELEELLGRLASLLEQVDTLEEGVRDTVYATLDTADELHRRALRRLGDSLDAETLEALRERHPELGWLLDAYGVGVDQVAAAQAALADLRPYLESRGGHAEVLDVIDGVVHLRFSGALAGTAEAPTLQEDVDRALHEQVPGFVRIAVEEQQADPQPTGTLLEIQPRPPEPSDQASADRESS